MDSHSCSHEAHFVVAGNCHRNRQSYQMVINVVKKNKARGGIGARRGQGDSTFKRRWSGNTSLTSKTWEKTPKERRERARWKWGEDSRPESASRAAAGPQMSCLSTSRHRPHLLHLRKWHKRLPVHKPETRESLLPLNSTSLPPPRKGQALEMLLTISEIHCFP